MQYGLCISLFIFGAALAVPTLYKDRQDGKYNVKVGLDDISFLIIPPTKLLDDVVQVFGRNAETTQVSPAEGQSKQSDPQNSPYTVELSSSNAAEAKPNEEQVIRIPAAHVQEKPEEENKKEQEPVKKVVEDPKKVIDKKKVEDGVRKTAEEPKKKVEDAKKKVADGVKLVGEEPKKKVAVDPKKKVEDGTRRVAEDTKKKIDDGKKKMKMAGEEEEVLMLIQSGIEECGPDGKRNPQGICVYTPINT